MKLALVVIMNHIKVLIPLIEISIMFAQIVALFEEILEERKLPLLRLAYFSSFETCRLSVQLLVLL